MGSSPYPAVSGRVRSPVFTVRRCADCAPLTRAREVVLWAAAFAVDGTKPWPPSPDTGPDAAQGRPLVFQVGGRPLPRKCLDRASPSLWRTQGGQPVVRPGFPFRPGGLNRLQPCFQVGGINTDPKGVSYFVAYTKLLYCLLLPRPDSPSCTQTSLLLKTGYRS